MIDFGSVSPGLPSREHRNKAAEEMKARLSALPAECSTSFTSGLPMQMREALAVVVRAYKAEGGVACRVHRADIAKGAALAPLVQRAVRMGIVLDHLEPVDVGLDGWDAVVQEWLGDRVHDEAETDDSGPVHQA